MAKLEIKIVDIATAVAISQRIPEFVNPPTSEEYERRLKKGPHLILAAYDNKKAVGFKVGYERESGFYSWMGGVVPSYRRQNIALKLALHQEKWARSQGYKAVTFKTRNQHKNMLLFALRRGFQIIGFKEKEDVTTNRILLSKVL